MTNRAGAPAVSLGANAFARLYPGGRPSLETFLDAAVHLDFGAVEASDRVVGEPDEDAAGTALAERGLAAPSFAVANDFVDASRSLEDEIAHVVRWAGFARALGATSLRVFVGEADPSDEQARERASFAFGRLVPRVAELGVRVVVETHGGLSSDPTFLRPLVERFGLSACGVCLDWGRVPLGDGTLEQLVPLTAHVHVKTHSFAPDGSEETFPVAAIVGALLDRGYDGIWVLEYEGDPPFDQGTRRTRQLLASALESPTIF